jgi:hypothetical protein
MNVRGSCVSLAPRCSQPNAGVTAVHIITMPQSKMRRIAWSYLRHPVKCREFPAKHERLITPDELLRYGV